MFRFSLETALSVRARQEKVSMKELAQKLAHEKSILDKMDSMKGEVQKRDKDLDERKREGRFSIEELRNQENFKRLTETRLGGLGAELAKAQEEVQEKRQALVLAAQKRKTLEILEAREKKRYEAKVARAERMLMDEIASSRHHKNQL